MPMKYLGRVLFPRMEPWLRERKIKIIIVVLVVAVGFAAIVGGLILFSNSRHM